MKKMKMIKQCIGVLGTTALFLTACGGKAPDTVTEAPTEAPTEVPTEAPTEAPVKVDDLSLVISEIEGVWGTAHVPQDLRVFEGGTEYLYNAEFDLDTLEVSGYRQSGMRQIKDAEKTSDSTGEYYRIELSDSDVTYYWYPDRPDDLEYHWGDDSYSASDSLVRMKGAVPDDYPIVDDTAAEVDINRLYIDFVTDPYDFAWDGSYYSKYTFMGMDYGWNGFALVDFDGDGCDEVIATNTDEATRIDGGMQSYLIAYYRDGELFISELADGVASAGGYRGTKYYLPGGSLIYDDSFSAPWGAPSFSIYRLQDGIFSFSEGGYLDPDSQNYDYPESFEHGQWYLADRESTKEEYEKAFKLFTNDHSGFALSEIEYLSKNDIIKELRSRQ